MRLLFCSLLILLSSSSLCAADYYVSYSTGDDIKGNGSQASPWKTTRKVRDTSSFGEQDKVYFKRGDVWTNEIDCESYCFYIGWKVDKKYPSTYSAYGSGSLPILPRLGFVGTQSGYRFSDLKFVYTGANGAAHACTIWDRGNINTEFKDCQFENDNHGDTVFVYKSNGVSFKNCIITGGNEAGLTINDADNCTITNCYLSGFVNAVLLYQNASNNLVANNKCFSLSHSGGAPIELGWGNPDNNRVINNVCVSNNYGLFVSGTSNKVMNNSLWSKSFSLILSGNTNANSPKCSYNIIAYNTFRYGKRIYVGHNVDPKNGCIENVIANNIFVVYDDAFIQYTSDSANAGASWFSNCVQQLNGTFKVFVDGGIIRDFSSWDNRRNNVYASPVIDNDTGRILKNSPCIGKAKELKCEMVCDIDNDSRGSNDIGCFAAPTTIKLQQ